MKSIQLCLAAVVLFVATASFGQQSFMDEPGIPAFTTSFPVEHGFINIANGALHLEIPIASYPQRGSKLQYHARLVYDSRVWTFNGNNEDPLQSDWQPNGVQSSPIGIGWRLITDEEGGTPNNSQTFVQCGCVGTICQLRTTYKNFTYQEPNGTTHRAPRSFTLTSAPMACGGPLIPSGSTYADDNSGYKFVVNGATSVYAPDGLLVTGPGPAAVQDTNGNFSSYSSGNVMDTLGRVPVITSTSGNLVLLDYLNPQGSRSRITLTTFTLNLATQFSNGSNFTGTWPALQSVVFPDNTSYQFQYDSYGQITSITLPTGGQITYGYSNVQSNNNTFMGNRWLTSRMADGNTWTFTPIVTSCTTPCNPLAVTVTTPSYNDGTITASDNHVYTFFFPSPNGGGGAWPAQIQIFRGATSGTPRLTLTKEYNNGQNNSCQQPMGNALIPVLIRETLAWPAGAGTLSKKAEYCYDSNGINQITKKLWDYQPNGSFAPAPDREVDTTYVTDPAYVNANILQLPLVVTSLGPGGVQVAKTTLAYDGGSLQSANITTNHTTPSGPRGNLTSVSKWLNTTGGSVTSTTKWFDTGEVYQSIDPLLHTTTFSYDSAFSGAYLTQSCNALTPAQCSYNGYDFNTGLRTSFTDVNGSQAGDPTHTTNYTFDTLLRPLCTNLPDGGQTCLSYPDANHVSRQQLINASLPPDSSTTVFDGLGRVSQTQHTLPDGVSKVDTTYDPVGAPFTVNNPYFTTADPTYGITQSFHDALGRGVKTIRQDGSVSSSAYSVRNSGTANGTCVTATDEAGKQRMACHNGFGELVEVDEPGTQPPPQNNHATLDTTGNFVLANAANTALWSTGTSGTNASSIFMQDDGNLVAYIFKWQAGVYATPTPGSYPQQGCSIGSAYLVAGQRLNGGQCIVSPHGQYFLLMNTDGNFFIYDWAHATGTWGPGTQGHPGAYAIFQTDGNLVVYDVNGTALWNSGTSGTYAERLDMEDDGRIIIYKSAWNSGTSNGQFNGTVLTHPGCDVGIGTGTTGVLGSGQCFVSPNGHFELLLQSDGNMVIYDLSVTPNVALWSTGTAVTVFSPGVALQTLYTYDALGNLTCVEQHGDAASGTACPATPPGPTDAPAAPDPNNAWRRRLFAYDSLSRLRWASNPESGIITYTYDSDGELLQKTSPLANQAGTATQTVSYCYDELHRVTGKGYGAQSCPLATPVVIYAYDSGANAKGHLTSLLDQAGTASYAYDILGRLTSETRTLIGANNASIPKNLSYSYNLDGSLKTLTYPSGNVVTYTPDSAGRTLSAVDSGSGINYVTGATYGPDSALTGFVSGNSGTFAGITNSFAYNKRLQSLTMSATAPSQTVFSIGYDFHAGNGTANSGTDNGNVYGIINYKDTTHGRDQTFTYDLLNRLISAQNAGTNCATMVLQNKTEYWGNSYGYDAWGNLRQKNVTKCGAENLSVTADAHNWIHTTVPDYQYDAAGNMTYDATASLSYTFDQENRLTGAAGYTYTYDADGNRVRKSNGNLAANGTLYWYMAPGVVAETDLAGTTQSEYIFFDGGRVARRDGATGSGGVFYYFSDHLKTASVITDSAGVIKAESEYYPWGGELKFVDNDSNHYKLTGKERDGETGLDYFGARYYSNGLGRWVSADWSATPVPVPYAHFDDPQSLNLYAFVGGNPASKVDLDGHGFWRKFWDCINGNACMTDEEFKKWQAEDFKKSQAQEKKRREEWEKKHPGKSWGQHHADELRMAELFGFTPVGELSFGAEALEAGLASRPLWAKTAGGFVNWLKNLSKAGTKLSAKEADEIIGEAKNLGVEVRLDPPHPGTNWEVPHLNIGKEGQVHLEVPQGYSNATVPTGSATRP